MCVCVGSIHCNSTNNGNVDTIDINHIDDDDDDTDVINAGDYDNNNNIYLLIEAIFNQIYIIELFSNDIVIMIMITKILIL